MLMCCRISALYQRLDHIGRKGIRFLLRNPAAEPTMRANAKPRLSVRTARPVASRFGNGKRRARRESSNSSG